MVIGSCFRRVARVVQWEIQQEKLKLESWANPEKKGAIFVASKLLMEKSEDEGWSLGSSWNFIASYQVDLAPRRNFPSNVIV